MLVPSDSDARGDFYNRGCDLWILAGIFELLTRSVVTVSSRDVTFSFGSRWAAAVPPHRSRTSNPAGAICNLIEASPNLNAGKNPYHQKARVLSIIFAFRVPGRWMALPTCCRCLGSPNLFTLPCGAELLRISNSCNERKHEQNKQGHRNRAHRRRCIGAINKLRSLVRKWTEMREPAQDHANSCNDRPE